MTAARELGYRDVPVWCHDCQAHVTVSGWVGLDRAVHITPRVMAAHGAMHATERGA